MQLGARIREDGTVEKLYRSEVMGWRSRMEAPGNPPWKTDDE
jgi:hypothetical protein